MKNFHICSSVLYANLISSIHNTFLFWKTVNTKFKTNQKHSIIIKSLARTQLFTSLPHDSIYTYGSAIEKIAFYTAFTNYSFELNFWVAVFIIIVHSDN